MQPGDLLFVSRENRIQLWHGIHPVENEAILILAVFGEPYAQTIVLMHDNYVIYDDAQFLQNQIDSASLIHLKFKEL